MYVTLILYLLFPFPCNYLSMKEYKDGNKKCEAKSYWPNHWYSYK